MNDHACRECSAAFPPDTNTRQKVCGGCRLVRRNRKTQLQRARRRASITGDEQWHGSMSGYCNHQCRCTACRTAYKAYHDEWRRRPEVHAKLLVRGRESARTPASLLRKRAYTYGITVERLTEMLAVGICDACGTTEPGRMGWCVDHDHACCHDRVKACGNCVRGLLCSPCNIALGAAHDDPDRLEGLAHYVRTRS